MSLEMDDPPSGIANLMHFVRSIISIVNLHNISLTSIIALWKRESPRRHRKYAGS